MIQSSPTYSRVQFSRSKHSIYISSIGKILNKEVSCHVKKEEKGLLFEKKHPTLTKVLLKIHQSVLKDAFNSISNFSCLKNTQINKVFLPEAILKNDTQAINSFREKLSTTQIDRYISLHLPVNRAKSSRFEKSSTQSTTIHKEKDFDSTYLENQQRYTNYSKSLDLVKMSQKVKLSDVKVFEYDASNSRSQVSKSRGKRDIIHIKYTEMVLGSQPTHEIKKIRNNKRQSSAVKVKEFRTEDFEEVTEIFDKQGLRKVQNDQCKPIRGEDDSPYIGKNRIRGAKRVNFSCRRQFQNIDIHC